MNSVFKPKYLSFLLQQFFFGKKIYKDNNGNEFIERKKTLALTYLLYLISFILFSPLFPLSNWLAQHNIGYRIILLSLIVISLVFIIETFHWFYAKFDLITENEVKNPSLEE